MKLLLVPLSATQTSATVWLCATEADSAPADFDLTVEKTGLQRIRSQDWRPVEVGPLRGSSLQTFIQTHTIDGLAPQKSFQVSAFGIHCLISTLPETIPLENQPFNVLLTSCFFAKNKDAQAFGHSIKGLPDEIKPHAKFFCGDQVYLDVPEVAFLPLTGDALARTFFGKYLNNWSEGGYQMMLQHGASYFISDDHEFWNNYPNFQLQIPLTLAPNGRQLYEGIGRELFRAFQCEDPTRAGRNQKFSIGRLSFCLADTRFNRLTGDQQFMDPHDFGDLVAWIGALPGPGVLVVGQLVFEEPVNFFKKKLFDSGLPDYHQYDDLVKALSNAKHSVLVLTGDVHYSRVAAATFHGVNQPDIFEVIASPSASIGVKAESQKAPGKFPSKTIAGVSSANTTTFPGGSGENNFATLQFFEAAPDVKVRVQHWIVKDSQLNPQNTVELTLR